MAVTLLKYNYFVQNYRKINPADCVDMDCDGLKKVIVEDLDGTLLGTPGSTVIPESEWQWDWPGGEKNVDRRRGLGDYRIPKAMLTDLSGNRINITSISHDRGMIWILHVNNSHKKIHLLT